jgi:hypothetical protein
MQRDLVVIILYGSVHSLYSALRPVRQEPEHSQATGMALTHCILGKFLGVGCHCFPYLQPVENCKNVKFALIIKLSWLVTVLSSFIYRCWWVYGGV